MNIAAILMNDKDFTLSITSCQKIKMFEFCHDSYIIKNWRLKKHGNYNIFFLIGPRNLFCQILKVCHHNDIELQSAELFDHISQRHSIVITTLCLLLFTDDRSKVSSLCLILKFWNFWDERTIKVDMMLTVDMFYEEIML